MLEQSEHVFPGVLNINENNCEGGGLVAFMHILWIVGKYWTYPQQQVWQVDLLHAYLMHFNMEEYVMCVVFTKECMR